MGRIRRTKLEIGMKNDIQRAGMVFSLYGTLIQFIERLADLLVKSKTDIVLLKDIIPEKNDQAAIFRRMKEVNLPGCAIDFIAWINLAKVVTDNWKDLVSSDIVQVFKNIIVHPSVKKTDMVNILHLFSSNSLMFYHYLNFEMQKNYSHSKDSRNWTRILL